MQGLDSTRLLNVEAIVEELWRSDMQAPRCLRRDRMRAIVVRVIEEAQQEVAGFRNLYKPVTP